MTRVIRSEPGASIASSEWLEAVPQLLGGSDPGQIAAIFLTGLVSGFFLSWLLTTAFGMNATKNNGYSPFVSDGLVAEDWDPSKVSVDGSSLMTDGERVIRLLVTNNGIMKQTAVVSGTDWSEAKASRVLQRMEQEGDISRIKVGRHNMVFLGEIHQDLEV